MTPETIPLWHSLAGGALIGAGAALLMLFDGQIAGISGIVGNLLRGTPGVQAWRVAFLCGLLLPAAFVGLAPVQWTAPTLVLAAAGFLVGVGTRIGGGCTSGHGVCGIANLSPRSIVATLTFIAFGMATVALYRLAGHT